MAIDQALAWVWEQEDPALGPIVYKDGQVGGYICEVIVNTENNRVVAVATNSGMFSANDIAEDLIPIKNT